MRFRLIFPLVLVACGGGQSNTPSASPPNAPITPTSASSASTTAATTATGVKQVDKVDVPASIQALLAAPDRSDDDKKLDAGRHPGEMLAFFGIAPGEHVAEIEAGLGYTSELLARAVAPNGTVYAQNNKFLLQKFAEKPWSERLAKPVMKNVVRVDRELDDPLPPEAHDLDAVLCVLFYHDTVWMNADRDKMNASIFKALKSGGVYGIVDHNAKDGSGTNDVQTLHRIEEKVVVAEVTKAGFRLDAEASFLRNPNDPRDWSASPKSAGDKRGTSDRFVLKFVKP